MYLCSFYPNAINEEMIKNRGTKIKREKVAHEMLFCMYIIT